MRPWALSLLACCFIAARAAAQVSVEIVLDQQQFLKDESVPLKVRITNRSGQTVHFGKSKDWLTFSAESRDGYLVAKLRDPDPSGEFSLESATVGTRRVDVGPCFDFAHPGRYTIAATVKIPEWDQEINSHPVLIEVVRGTKIWEQEFGVPAKQGAPEMRKYVLQQARFMKDMTLYARVTDGEENRTFRVFPVGTLLSFSRPEAQVDKESKLHVIFQNGPHSYLYTIIDPDGTPRSRNTYDIENRSAVRLRAGPNGDIFVSGGIRRMNAEEAAALLNTNDIKTPNP